MKQQLKDRINAGAIHLAISAVILVIILVLILFLWYPNGLFRAGASQGLTILILVDLVLGPLLTFLVFNKDKRSLKFDLLCIAILQLACLGYGLNLIHNERPIIHVLADDGIHLITLSETKIYQIDRSYSIFSSPDYVLIQNPDNRDELRAAKGFSEIIDGKPYVSNFNLYKSMNAVAEQEYKDYVQFIYAGLDDLALTALQELNNNQQAHCDWVPLISFHISGYACIDKVDGIERFKQSK